MPRTALLCWEAGRGLGHALSLVAIAQHLKARGWQAKLAFPSDRAPSFVKTGPFRVVAAPRWGEGLPALPKLTKSSATMGDILAEIGLQSADWVRQQVGRWRALFDDYRPDLIVADYAPGAVLAARSRIPCLVSGVGFTVPPGGLRRFPALHELAPAAHDEEEVLATVNAVLDELGVRSLSALPQALTGNARCACTLPILDPYAKLRGEPVLGPLLSGPVARRSPEADEIFCYLREPIGSTRLPDILAALKGLPRRVVAYLPGLDKSTRARLRRAGVDVLQKPAPVGEQLAKSRLLVHFGGHGTAAAALLAGVPQIILGFDIEKSLIAAGLGQRGVVRSFNYATVGTDELHSAVLTALEDRRMEREAALAAEEYGCYRRRDVVSEVAEAAERLVG